MIAGDVSGEIVEVKNDTGDGCPDGCPLIVDERLLGIVQEWDGMSEEVKASLYTLIVAK